VRLRPASTARSLQAPYLTIGAAFAALVTAVAIGVLVFAGAFDQGLTTPLAGFETRRIGPGDVLAESSGKRLGHRRIQTAERSSTPVRVAAPPANPVPATQTPRSDRGQPASRSPDPEPEADPPGHGGASPSPANPGHAGGGGGNGHQGNGNGHGQGGHPQGGNPQGGHVRRSTPP